MHKKNRKPIRRKIVLRLPDLDHAKNAVLNSLSSPNSRRNYKFAMEQFITWYCSEPRLALNRAVVLRFRLYLESLGLAAGTINQRLAAVRRLAYEAADSGLLSPELAAGIRRVKGVKQLGSRAGNWLIRDQARMLLEKIDGEDLRSVRDLAMLSVLLGCGLRRAELSALKLDDLQNQARALGCRGSNWKGRSHSDCADATLGQGRYRSLDICGHGHIRPGFPGGQSSRNAMG
jgi:site-specific recombinase XerC